MEEAEEREWVAEQEENEWMAERVLSLPTGWQSTFVTSKRLVAGEQSMIPTSVISSQSIIFNGFIGANLSRDGATVVTPEGLLTTDQSRGHALYPVPLHFRPSPNGSVLSFSTTFVFGIVTQYNGFSSHGFAFFISPTNNLSTALGVQYLDLFNSTSNGDPSNHIIAVEFDTILNPEFQDIDDNHVGIDVNRLTSNNASTAGYFSDGDGEFKNLSLVSGQPMQAWVDYDGITMQFNVTMSPLRTSKPRLPLLSSTINLSSIMVDPMYAGFSGSQGLSRSSHNILGWSLKIGGRAEELNLQSSLPSLPPRGNLGKKANFSRIWLLVLIAVAIAAFIVKRKSKFAELVEDWELQYGTHRFSYKDLFQATNGFTEKGLLGSGGFGRVYRGTLPTTNIEVAVKRASHESRQGIREFVAEIVSIGQLRHRNLVQLLGYCRRQGELLLVYEFMPNGSLDKLLFDKDVFILDWRQRLRIIKGVASGLLYLHRGWDKVVIHRDIKANNVLLDSELNGRLGDFGLARLYDHGKDPHTTHVAGTMGYLAPELTRTGKATTGTDVFAFGAFLLEVACGRRPLDMRAPEEEEVLVDWVVANWQRGEILKSSDRRLAGEYQAEEMELVLKLGLLCCHPLPEARPGMQQVMQILDGQLHLPEFSPSYLNEGITEFITDLGLISTGCDINARTSAGETPLMISAKADHAAIEGHSDACKVLLLQGDADCSLINHVGETALSLARKRSRSNKVTEGVLLDHLARSHVLAGEELCKHTREGRGSPHMKTVRMLESGVLTWGKSTKRNVECKEATARPSLNFLMNRRMEDEDGKLAIFRVVTVTGREIHFEASHASGLELWVRGINLIAKKAASSGA